MHCVRWCLYLKQTDPAPASAVPAKLQGWFGEVAQDAAMIGLSRPARAPSHSFTGFWRLQSGLFIILGPYTSNHVRRKIYRHANTHWWILHGLSDHTTAHHVT